MISPKLSYAFFSKSDIATDVYDLVCCIVYYAYTNMHGNIIN